MSADIVKKTGQILIILLFLIGMYHLLICLKSNEIIDVDKKYLYGLYYISNNLIFVTLLICIHKLLKKLKGLFQVYSKMPIIMLGYPIFKIIINIGYLFETTKVFLDKIKDFWSFILIILIIVTLIILKKLNKWYNG